MKSFYVLLFLFILTLPAMAQTKNEKRDLKKKVFSPVFRISEEKIFPDIIKYWKSVKVFEKQSSRSGLSIQTQTMKEHNIDWADGGVGFKFFF